MTREQTKIFSEILDANFEAVTTNSPEIRLKLSELNEQLKKSMGTKAYDKLMSLGKAMFDPIE